MSKDYSSFCTCCNPPQQVELAADSQSWLHDDTNENGGAQTAAQVYHVHLETSSRDCDGPFYTSRTVTFRHLRWDKDKDEDIETNGYDPDDLWRRLAQMHAPLTGPSTIKIELTDCNIRAGLFKMTWAESTDEGHSSGEMRGCYDPTCAHRSPSQRDIFAERMGY